MAPRIWETGLAVLNLPPVTKGARSEVGSDEPAPPGQSCHVPGLSYGFWGLASLSEMLELTASAPLLVEWAPQTSAQREEGERCVTVWQARALVENRRTLPCTGTQLLEMET